MRVVVAKPLTLVLEFDAADDWTFFPYRNARYIRTRRFLFVDDWGGRLLLKVNGEFYFVNDEGVHCYGKNVECSDVVLDNTGSSFVLHGDYLYHWGAREIRSVYVSGSENYTFLRLPSERSDFAVVVSPRSDSLRGSILVFRSDGELRCYGYSGKVG